MIITNAWINYYYFMCSKYNLMVNKYITKLVEYF